MASIDTSRRQLLAARLKSAIATAAVVGTLGGWFAFGAQPLTTAVSTTAPAAVAQVADTGAAVATGSQSTASGSTTSAATSGRARRAPVTSTRSSQ